MKKQPFSAQITVEGRNCAKVVNALLKRNVKVWDVKAQENAFSFCIAKKDFEKTFAILKKLCYNYKVKEYVSVKIAIKTLIKKIPLLTGAVLSVLFIAIFSNTYLGIKSDGSKAQEVAVIELLQSDGIKIGARLDGIDTDALKSRIIEKCKVADCSIKKQGNYLQITFLPTKSVLDKTASYDAIVSTDEAIITSVIAHSGTAKVKKGDVVKKGDLLISNLVKAQNGEDEIVVGASGIVWGEVYYRKTEIVSPIATVFVKTGKSKTYTVLSHVKKEFNSPPYALYEVKREKTTFNTILPLYYEKVTYEEIQERKVDIDLNEYAQNSLEKLKREYGLIIKDEGYELAKASNGTYMLTTYLVSEKIISMGV